MLTRLQTITSMFRSDPLGAMIYLVIFAAALLLSLILHEISHGYVAYLCGDPTAKMFGRLSLDPRKHLDPLGSLFMVLFGFGWAKPVPVNPRNYKHALRDDIFVSLAGIAMNLLLFIASLGLSLGVLRLMIDPELLEYYSFRNLYVVFESWQLGGLSQSGLTEYMKLPWLQYLFQFLVMMSTFNISLAIFNLIPIPPLDGYHVLNDIVFKGRLQMDRQMFNILQFALLALCMFGALNGLLSTCINGVYNFFLGLLTGTL